jgi:hypothetical protein
MHEQARKLRKLTVASRTLEDKNTLVLLAQLVETNHSSCKIFPHSFEYVTSLRLKAFRGGTDQFEFVNAKRTRSRLQMDDHSGVGSERSRTSQTLNFGPEMRQLVLYTHYNVARKSDS